MESPPQGQDSTPSSLPGFWRFYRPRLGDLVSGWWWAANFHNDLVGALLLTGVTLVTIAWLGDLLSELGEYASFLTPWLPRLSTVLLVALLVYAFLRVNYQRFMMMETAVRSEGQRAFEKALSEKQGELALWTMQRDTTMSRVTADWSNRANELQVEVDRRGVQIAALQGEVKGTALERDEALARLRAIDEAQPSLRIEPHVWPVRRSGQGTLGHEAVVRIVNDSEAVLVLGIYARIVECVRFLNGRWPSEKTLDMYDIRIWSGAASLRRIEGESGDFNTTAHFVVASLLQNEVSAHLAIDEPLRSRRPINAGPFGIKVEVGVANPGSRPIYGRFKLDLHTGQFERLSFTEWDEPALDVF